MTRLYSETEVISVVDELTDARLVNFVRASIVRPVQSEAGHMMYRDVDIARLQLLCDLSDSYTLSDDALDLVMSLVDQLSTMRGDMRALMQAVACEPDEVRLRINGALNGDF